MVPCLSQGLLTLRALAGHREPAYARPAHCTAGFGWQPRTRPGLVGRTASHGSILLGGWGLWLHRDNWCLSWQTAAVSSDGDAARTKAAEPGNHTKACHAPGNSNAAAEEEHREYVTPPVRRGHMVAECHNRPHCNIHAVDKDQPDSCKHSNHTQSIKARWRKREERWQNQNQRDRRECSQRPQQPPSHLTRRRMLHLVIRQ